MILVTGAAGKTGLAVLAALKKRGAKTRAFVKDDEQILPVRQAGAAEVVVGDLLDADVWPQRPFPAFITSGQTCTPKKCALVN